MSVIRTHVVLPADLVAEIDALVGKRGRSRWLREVIEARLRNDRLLRMAREIEPISAEDVPEWADRESIAAWVRAQRPVDDPWGEAERRSDGPLPA